MRWPFSRGLAVPPAPPRPARIAPALPAVRPPLTPGEAFTPTQPRAGGAQVFGRRAELERIVEALLDERAHVVLYSERGRGKTSLSNLVVQTLRRSGIIVARHTCEASSTFDSVMRGLLRDVPHALLAGPANAAHEVGCESALPPGPVRPHDVVGVMPQLTCRRLVCLVDEFDRIEDAATRTRLADTVKQLSDQRLPLLFVIVGVSENLEQILGQHPSIQRNLVAVQLPLLPREEVATIVETGIRQTGLAANDRTSFRIADLSRGCPYMAQLLGLRLVQATLRRGGNVVNDDDLALAIVHLVEDAPPRHTALYDGLTRGGRDFAMTSALATLALADQDVHGRFFVETFGPGDAVIVGSERLQGSAWTRILDNGAVRPAGSVHGQHMFADLAFMHHILLRRLQQKAQASHGASALNVVRADT